MLHQRVPLLQPHIRPATEMRRLLEEHRVLPRQLAHVDGELELLRGEDGVHDGDVGVGVVWGDGEDEDAGGGGGRFFGGGGCGGGGGGVLGGGGGGEAVDVCGMVFEWRLEEQERGGLTA